MDPITLSIVGGLGLLGGGLNLFASSQQAKAYKQAAAQAQANAQYSYDLSVSQAEQEQYNRATADNAERKAGRRQLASIEGMYAKSGVLLEGTPGYMIGEQATVNALNTEQKTLESLQRRRYMLAQGRQALIEGDYQSSALRQQAKTTMIQGYASMASSSANLFSGLNSAGAFR